MEKLLKISAIVLVVWLVGVSVFLSVKTNNQDLGSVNIANDYKSTTVLTTSSYAPVYVKSSPGALGSVTVVSTTVGQLQILDSDGTSTTTLFTSQASLPAGTYTFDRALNYGLVVSTTPAFNGQFFISYR